MAPRKKSEGAKSKAAAPASKPGEFVFGDPTAFDELPAKTNFGPSFKHLAALEVGHMINVGGATIPAMRNVGKKVIKEYPGRVFEYRQIDPNKGSAGVAVYRMPDSAS